jgi:hypothetical protein
MIKKSIKQLLNVVHQLKNAYPHKAFTLDGRLVGDLGEILVENSYKIKLYKKLTKFYDGETFQGKKVQIKATMKNSLTFPSDHIPDCYIGVKINEDGSFKEIYNGAGKIIHSILKSRKQPKNGLYSISIPRLQKLNMLNLKEDRIQKR